MSKKATVTKAPVSKAKRSYISQADIPIYSLEQSLKIPLAIIENYAGKPTTPLKVAQALNVQPGSSSFRTLCGAAVAYGLITGGAFASEIAIEPIAKKILKPLNEGDDLLARREALLKPRVIKMFLENYHNAALPKLNIAMNVLEELNVPADRTEEVFNIIIESAKSLGLITTIKDKQYVDLESVRESTVNKPLVSLEEDRESPEDITSQSELQDLLNQHAFVSEQLIKPDLVKRRKVFITHGKNKSFVEPIKKLLQFGELEAIVSVDRQSVSQPVPDKVLSDMRACGSAIIHVDAELKLSDDSGKEHIVLNPNVLIEIGAAMALYGRRFILLVKSGVTLPSNLQGLFEVRYTGDNLDGDATIRLLESINSMKNAPAPLEVDAQ